MKKLFSGLIFLLAIITTASTQAQSPPKVKAHLSEKTVVKDSSGTVYPYDIWTRLFSTGYYNMKPVNIADVNSEFLLVRISEEERQRKIDGMPKPEESKYFKTGEAISGFKARDINGNKINVKTLQGKVVVINFWFVNCAPCRMEIPELNQLVNEYKDSTNIVFIGVALDGESDLREFLKKTPYNYTIVDNGRFIADQYGVKSYPTHLVIDKEGTVSYHTTGYSLVTVTWLPKSIKALLPGPGEEGKLSGN